MASIQLHTINGRQYAYSHFREGTKVRSQYLYPVGSSGQKRTLLINRTPTVRQSPPSTTSAYPKSQRPPISQPRQPKQSKIPTTKKTSTTSTPKTSKSKSTRRLRSLLSRKSPVGGGGGGSSSSGSTKSPRTSESVESKRKKVLRRLEEIDAKKERGEISQKEHDKLSAKVLKTAYNKALK